ncbi:MAG: FKBP-type peptidyl-prolyl cis-trans isomerase [Tannerellaceae bacterium]|jgi:FKBP-type peptidyl-prolyl cis-trans isomerase FklB|nr:FKBP-type peptidyl-prolyl cis-trans isomerase [Tannerellaceae bacterium]
MDKISYALGLSIGNNFLGAGITDLILSDFVKGMSDVMSGSKPEIDYEEAKKIIDKLFSDIQVKNSELNLKAGEEFLQINKHKAGVTELPSGLQYEVLVKGEGNQPRANDRVRCHYHGTLINGVVFDSSIQRGEPAVFKIREVIAGWSEALQLMNVGAKWRLFIPSSLAYGNRGAGDKIAPNSTLVFVVELLDIIK